MRLALMVAMARNRVIGRNNRLPWYLPEELQYFKRATMGKPIIMGRCTHESIGRPLPGRSNIVITRNAEWSREGVCVVHSFEQALEQAERQGLIDGAEETVVIGGAQIYAEALPMADRLYLTEVHAEVAGDTFFPEVDLSRWEEVSREDHAGGEEANRYPYSAVVYDRGEY
ncbi:dihydrofolate reductase [Salicola sp. Rm-C-2C1-2]|uniref:dihydrofolate reductase n=1 Tax=Salicola sp. Rm-C-2C1-2 TaxID=3141321 RepID=UPI0032E518D3